MMGRIIWVPHVYFAGTFVLSCWTHGIAVPSGLFVPCILMGCSLGAYGEVMRLYIFPGAIFPWNLRSHGSGWYACGRCTHDDLLTVILMHHRIYSFCYLS